MMTDLFFNRLCVLFALYLAFYAAIGYDHLFDVRQYERDERCHHRIYAGARVGIYSDAKPAHHNADDVCDYEYRYRVRDIQKERCEREYHDYYGQGGHLEDALKTYNKLITRSALRKIQKTNTT